MNDETTKEIEDLSTLACSTDEVARKRALVAMLGRVVERASQVDHEWETPADVDNADRYALEANLREVTQQRDTHKANAETLARDLAEARAEVERLRSLAGSPEKVGRVLTREDMVKAVGMMIHAYSMCPGGISESYEAILRWLEREGYLSVRLPPEG